MEGSSIEWRLRLVTSSQNNYWMHGNVNAKIEKIQIFLKLQYQIFRQKFRQKIIFQVMERSIERGCLRSLVPLVGLNGYKRLLRLSKLTDVKTLKSSLDRLLGKLKIWRIQERKLPKIWIYWAAAECGILVERLHKLFIWK